MKNEGKRRPIRRRVTALLLVLSMGALIFTGVLWFGSLIVVRNRVASDSEDLGDTAYAISSSSMTELIEQNYIVNAENRAKTMDAALERYTDYVRSFAFYIHRLYQEPDAYVPREVLPADAKSAYRFTMQLCYAGEGVDKAALAGEVGLLANTVHIWQPVMESPNSKIGSIYLCTESGFMINYDERSDLTPEYFDYYDREWYREAKETNGMVMTNAYPDTFGRGLMVTCAAPFYDAAGGFAGTVCIDFMIDDLSDIMHRIDLGEGTCAYLVDSEGKMFLSSGSGETADFDALTDAERQGDGLMERIAAGKSGGEYGGKDGGLFFAYCPISSANWMLVFQIPSNLITEPSLRAAAAIEQKTDSTISGIHRNILIALLLNLAIILLVHFAIAVISRLFSKQLTEPLLELGEDVAVISSGDLEHRAEIYENDEIGDLARSFNSMAASLDGYIKDLTRVTAERERIGAELDIAKHIQASMLPCIFPAFPDREEFDIYATMNPAKEVGGDFYDFFMVDRSHLAIVMADVSGKGVPAALFMVIGKTLIKDHTEPEADLGAVFTEVNNILCSSNSEGLFITAFEGVLYLVSGEFRFVNAGHETPFIAKAGDPFRAYKVRAGFVLAGMEDIVYKSGSLMLKPGDKIFQYTDGVTEAMNSRGELYGMERLGAVLERNSARSPEEILAAVKADIDGFVGEAEQFDDITMLAMEFKRKMGEERQ